MSLIANAEQAAAWDGLSLGPGKGEMKSELDAAANQN